MPFTPVIKTTTQLLADISNQIKANGLNEITGDMLGQLLSDITASLVNKVENLNLLGLTNYDAGGRQYKGGLTGDCCIKDGMLLQCITDTQGVFVPNHWKILMGIETLSRSQLITKRNAGTLNPCVLYKITDNNIYLRAASENQLDQRGVRVYRTPRYGELNGDGHLITVWGLPEASAIVVDQHVVYDGFVYVRTDATNNFDNPVNNSTDYSFVAQTSSLYKDFPIAITYDIDQDQVTSARDTYGNIVVMNKSTLDALSLADPYLDSFRWGDSGFSNNIIYNALLVTRTNAIIATNNVLYPGSLVTFSEQSSRTAVFNQNVVWQGSNINAFCYENSSISNSVFLPGSDFTQKVLVADYVINNFTLGIQWPDSSAIGTVELSNKTITKSYNDVMAELDLDLFLTNPTGGIWELDLLSVWWAGIIKFKSSSSATGATINRIKGYDGTWTYRFIAGAIDIVAFEDYGTNPSESLLYFDQNDSIEPFTNSTKGFIEFRRIDGTNDWICERSKRI